MDNRYVEACDTIGYNFEFAYFFWSIGSMTIVLMNFFLRLLIIYMIRFMGYSTETRKTSTVLVAVFAIQFINTDLIVLLMNADLSQIWPNSHLENTFYQGLYGDFTLNWYKNIGKLLVDTMIFNIYWPVLEFILLYLWRLLFRLIDVRCRCRKWQTKSKTIDEYVTTY